MRIGAAIFIMAIVLFGMAALAYADQDYREEDLRIFDGKVVALDIQNGTITVKSALEKTFKISKNTQLIDDIYDIELSDLDLGDYVTVEYVEKEGAPIEVLTITKEYNNDD